MAGTSQLVCTGFIESKTYKRSKADLMALLEIDDEEIDDRLKALLWSLTRDPSANSSRVGERNLWVAVTPGGIPQIRIFLRPREDVPDEAELLWIEERV
jgi:hypothetical protein